MTAKWRITLQLLDTPTKSEKHLTPQEIFDMIEKCLMNIEAGIDCQVIGVLKES